MKSMIRDSTTVGSLAKLIPLVKSKRKKKKEKKEEKKEEKNEKEEEQNCSARQHGESSVVEVRLIC